MLRRLKYKDAENMLEWMHCADIAKKYKTCFEQFELNDALEFIKGSFSDDNRHFAYVDEMDEYLGTVSLKNISSYNKNAECTYAFRSKVQPEQIREAISEIKEYAFCVMQLSEIYSHVFEEDEQSASYYLTNGFVKGGTYVMRYQLRDMYHNMCWYYIHSKISQNVDEHEMLQFQERGDSRGHMVVIEGLKDVPFEIKRIFYIYGSDAGVVRGMHANRKSEFVLINVAGTSKVKVMDGKKEKIYILDKPHSGVYLPRMAWKEMYDFSPDSVLLVLSNEFYDESEYLRDYKTYMQELEVKNV